MAGGHASLGEASPALSWTASDARHNDGLSDAWRRFTGQPHDALVGEGWLRSVHPEDVARCIGIRAASFDAATPFAMDFRLRRHDGDYRWMYDSGEPRRGPDGALAGYVGSCVDIDDRKHLEESLAERTQSLRLAERRQGVFLAMLSHELRGPLAPMGNVASVLRTLEHTNPILVRLREILERQVGKLGGLVEDLVDATRAAQGQISLVRERVSVESVVQTAVASSHAKIIAGGHDLQVEVPDQRLYVMGDAARLAQALGQVLANAARFSVEPGAISISVRRAARTVQIAVRDRGIGMSAAFLPHAFELFAQEDQNRSRSQGGLGAGLTLARKIAQLHGGDLEAFSEGRGLGSELLLWLPLTEPAAAAPSERQAPSRAPRLAESFRVLIVEDNPDARESLRLQMELWGNDVTVAGNADDAIRLAATGRPQIVLCDIGLPGIDGYDLVAGLRRQLDGEPVVFAAVTGYAGAHDQARAIAAGFDAFLVKPLDADDLVKLLRSYATRAG